MNEYKDIYLRMVREGSETVESLQQRADNFAEDRQDHPRRQGILAAIEELQSQSQQEDE